MRVTASLTPTCLRATQGPMSTVNLVLMFVPGGVVGSWIIWLACYKGEEDTSGDSGVQKMER
jgi:hypothetical protein